MAANVAIVIVDDPDPGAAIDAGEKVAVAPLGRPDALSKIAELNPPDTAVVIVLLPDVPWTSESEVGESATEKSAADGLKTMSRTGWISMPLGATPVCPCRKSKKPTPRMVALPVRCVNDEPLGIPQAAYEGLAIPQWLSGLVAWPDPADPAMRQADHSGVVYALTASQRHASDQEPGCRDPGGTQEVEKAVVGAGHIRITPTELLFVEQIQITPHQFGVERHDGDTTVKSVGSRIGS